MVKTYADLTDVELIDLWSLAVDVPVLIGHGHTYVIVRNPAPGDGYITVEQEDGLAVTFWPDGDLSVYLDIFDEKLSMRNMFHFVRRCAQLGLTY